MKFRSGRVSTLKDDSVLKLQRKEGNLLTRETGYELWLRYTKITDPQQLKIYRKEVTAIVVQGNSPTLEVICNELTYGLNGLLAQDTLKSDSVITDGSVVVGTPASSPILAALGLENELQALGDEGYIIRTINIEGKASIVIASSGELGGLYGTFHFLRLIQTYKPIMILNIVQKPKVKLRLLNHWDNLIPNRFGSIERGYSGNTIWKWDELPDTIDQRYQDYARANASLGINGAVMNNVNAEPWILTGEYLKKLTALADVFRPYGIKVYVSANYAAPLKPANYPDFKDWGGIGELESNDPLDPKVSEWWRNKVSEIYSLIPDFGGFLIKADSENMPGPKAYSRTHAEGANMLADALAPYRGIVMWRAFVYSKDNDPDRAKQAYLEFTPLDGQFRNNVLLQIKNGPLDFQPREPFNPLFGSMTKTPLMMELQITQEYLGHSNHLVYLAPMWKTVLESDTYSKGDGSTLAHIVDGSIQEHSLTGIAGVANIGDDANWCGHHFAQANWYAFGRLAWDHTLTSEEIAKEWARMTWGNDDKLVGTITAIMLGSWEACVNYMTPQGLCFTVDGKEHYDPLPQNRNRRYWFADETGIGYDRTIGGSNAVSQYHEPLRSILNNPALCPEEFLLWFHFVKWDRRMRSGRTLWEELCHKYEDGVRYVSEMKHGWDALATLIDPERHAHVKNRLCDQESHAVKWKDTYIGYFRSTCGL